MKGRESSGDFLRGHSAPQHTWRGGLDLGSGQVLPWEAWATFQNGERSAAQHLRQARACSPSCRGQGNGTTSHRWPRVAQWVAVVLTPITGFTPWDPHSPGVIRGHSKGSAGEDEGPCSFLTSSSSPPIQICLGPRVMAAPRDPLSHAETPSPSRVAATIGSMNWAHQRPIYWEGRVRGHLFYGDRTGRSGFWGTLECGWVTLQDASPADVGAWGNRTLGKEERHLP